MRSTRIVEMLEVTEAAALAAGRWMGKGDKHAADDAAVEGMRRASTTLTSTARSSSARASATRRRCSSSARRSARAARRSTSPSIRSRARTSPPTGSRTRSRCWRSGPKGTLLHAPDTYMNKIAVGPEAADVVHIDASPTENIRNVAKALNATSRTSWSASSSASATST